MPKKQIKKLFIVRKYIFARSAAEALRLERKLRPDDVWVDDDWKRASSADKSPAISFMAEPYDDD
jgi:hypothetical protein